MIRLAPLLLLAAVSGTSPALAQDSSRDLCANRPGRGSPPCILDVGRFQVETSLVDFTHDKQPGSVVDTSLFADLAFRLGISKTSELQLAWSPYVGVKTRDLSGVSRVSGYSDVTLAYRQSLANPDGSGFSIAVQPYVSAPVGRKGIGAGAWQGGLAVPISIALPSGFALGLTPQAAVVRNQAHDGAHLNWTGVIGVSHPIGPYSLGAELYANRDDDPAGGTTRATFDLFTAWTPPWAPDTQFDVGLNAGLNRQTPDYEAYLGIARRF